MEPKFNKGDLVMIVKGDFNNLKEGDIVTFTNPRNRNDVVTHNFVKYEEYDGQTVLRTKGNRSSDGGDAQLDFWKITEQDFIGVYKYHIPKIGNLVAFLQSWYGFAAILLISGVIAGAYYAIRWYNKQNTDESSEEETSQA